jgi:hypothetical protein
LKGILPNQDLGYLERKPNISIDIYRFAGAYQNISISGFDKKGRAKLALPK